MKARAKQLAKKERAAKATAHTVVQAPAENSFSDPDDAPTAPAHAEHTSSQSDVRTPVRRTHSGQRSSQRQSQLAPGSAPGDSPTSPSFAPAGQYHIRTGRISNKTGDMLSARREMARSREMASARDLTPELV